MKIILVDDHQMFRDSIAAVISASVPEAEVQTAGSVSEALALAEKFLPDLLIADLGLNGESGMNLLQEVNSRYPDVNLMVLSMHADMGNLQQALREGAAGYITKGSDTSTLTQAVRTVADGGYYFDQLMLDLMVNFIRNEKIPSASTFLLAGLGLTEREQEILLLLVQNRDLKSIGEQLFISLKTVENHRSSIYRKLGIKDRAGLIDFAKTEGLLQE
jgi:DNA-binding NarL/FixJ family response regulator